MRAPAGYRQLLVIHQTAAARIRFGEGTTADDEREQAAWDSLIDFVEEHGLTYTALDPRQS